MAHKVLFPAQQNEVTAAERKAYFLTLPYSGSLVLMRPQPQPHIASPNSVFALARVLGKSTGGSFCPSSVSADKAWPFLRKNVITLFPTELQAMVEDLSCGPGCLLRKLSSGNNIYLMVNSSMENTAKTFGNTNTGVFPLQTRKRGGKAEWMQGMEVQFHPV